jgi:hypothetical protein
MTVVWEFVVARWRDSLNAGRVGHVLRLVRLAGHSRAPGEGVNMRWEVLGLAGWRALLRPGTAALRPKGNKALYYRRLGDFDLAVIFF